jgi:hypothetical protein
MDEAVTPANIHDLSATTEHERAAMDSGATDASRSRDSSVLVYYRQTRPRTDEPSVHPWHQTSIDSLFSRHTLSGKSGNPGKTSGFLLPQE